MPKLQNAAFLQDGPQDCLEIVLSYLSLSELGKTALTCRRLAEMIHPPTEACFRRRHAINTIDLIWYGAFHGMEGSKHSHTNFYNLRDYCRFFRLAQQFAVKCDDWKNDEDARELRVSPAGVLSDLFHLHGCDMESVAVMVQEGKLYHKTLDEEAASVEKHAKRATSNSEAARESKPERPCHHAVFVRVLEISTEEVLGQGFCSYFQNTTWHAPLANMDPYEGAGHKIHLMLQGFPRVKEYLRSFEQLNTIQTLFGDQPKSLDLRFTIVVVDKRDGVLKCLFHDNGTSAKTPNEPRPFILGLPGEFYTFDTNPLWEKGSDSMQIGDWQYSLDFSAGYGLIDNGEEEDEHSVVPVFEIFLVQGMGSLR